MFFGNCFRITPLLHVVQTFLNEPALYEAITELPVNLDFLTTIISIATHPAFPTIQGKDILLGIGYPSFPNKHKYSQSTSMASLSYCQRSEQCSAVTRISPNYSRVSAIIEAL